MASPRFILKTDLTGLEPVALGGAAALDADARLRALLGPERAALFAEPVVTWGNGRNPAPSPGTPRRRAIPSLSPPCRRRGARRWKRGSPPNSRRSRR